MISSLVTSDPVSPPPVLTTVTNLWSVIPVAALGLAGMGGFAYYLLN